MDLIHLLKDYTRYNVWANQKMIDWLSQTPEKLDETTPSSFPTLSKTLLHIWAAEDVWLRRLKKESSVTFLAQTFQGNNADLIKGFLDTSRQFNDFVATAETAFFQDSIHYSNTKGDKFSTPNTEVILHCMQHSTYHRGQLVTMGRRLGLSKPPQTDYIAYVRNRPS